MGHVARYGYNDDYTYPNCMSSSVETHSVRRLLKCSTGLVVLFSVEIICVAMMPLVFFSFSRHKK